jgi:hypothetical protein
MNSSLLSSRAWVVTTLVTSVCGCACPKVYPPASDSTPPSITWKVTNNTTNAVQNFTGDAEFQAKLGEHYVVKMTASDTDGVHEASVSDSVAWSCKQGNVVESEPPTLGVPIAETHDVWPSGQVCSSIELFEDVDLAFSCSAGYQFTSGSVEVRGSGENFFNGVTKAKLTINVVP